MSFPKGTAPIKSQYLIPVADLQDSTNHENVESAAERLDTSEQAIVGVVRPREDKEQDEEGEPPAKRVKLSGAQKKKLAKENKSKGQNKSRRFQRVHDEGEICWKLACGLECERGEQCRGSHDLPSYLASKPPDLQIPVGLLSSPPWIEPLASPQRPFLSSPGTDISTRCPYFDELGECKVGFKCRFLGAHVREDEEGQLQLVKNSERIQWAASNAVERNGVQSELLKQLRKREFPLPISKQYAAEVKNREDPPSIRSKSDQIADDSSRAKGAPELTIQFPEKKRLHWKGLTYLAPLTTVGNLPFRRLCSTLGADITCGEMGLSASFLQGSKEEWSLVRRHPCERIFGVQIAGSKPEIATACAEAIGNACEGGIDFVDLNVGCPIDLVYQTGSGSALLNTTGKLGKIVYGMNLALGSVPVTVKMRTGVKDGAPTTHKLMPRIRDWGVGSVAIHGRTRQQRYAKLADWDYIKSCLESLRADEEESGVDPIPFWGNGDCFSGVDYWKTVDATGVDGIMIGRGALIKPWIFTEIKERRDWDISSRERLDLVRKYAEYGLCHFGSDTAGVNTTRRYLCEALSFWYRYIPIGLLELLPPKLNDRAPAYKGRDELETLLASPDSRTWVKISEMFLGPAPTEWNFVPKHKSNAYANDEGMEAQG